MQEFQFSLQHIADGQGVPIALTGMAIVFTALTLIVLFIAALPRILQALEPLFPPPPADRPASSSQADAAGVVAAIAVALHAERQRRSAGA